MAQLRDKDGLTEAEFLANYDASRYPRPSVTVDIAVFTPIGGRLCVLLIRRGGHPFLGSWALPGGFIDMDEDLPRAAQRELREETSLDGLPLVQLGAFGAPGRDPRTRIVTVAYLALAPRGSVSPRAGDDAADAQWFAVEIQAAPEPNRRRLLLAGPATLAIEAQLGHDGLALCVSSATGDLATDHSLILAHAAHTLCTKAPQAACNLLAGGDDALEQSLLAQLAAWEPRRV